MTETAALQGALAAEHADVWGYGVVGAALAADPALAPTVRACDAVHRDRRDRTAALLRARAAEPTAAEASYDLPFPVTDAASALRLAVQLEDGTAAVWRFLLGSTDDPALRTTARDALVDAAVRALAWRQAAGVVPVSVALPGL